MGLPGSSAMVWILVGFPPATCAYKLMIFAVDSLFLTLAHGDVLYWLRKILSDRFLTASRRDASVRHRLGWKCFLW